jgi:hypothetical protein
LSKGSSRDTGLSRDVSEDLQTLRGYVLLSLQRRELEVGLTKKPSSSRFYRGTRLELLETEREVLSTREDSTPLDVLSSREDSTRLEGPDSPAFGPTSLAFGELLRGLSVNDSGAYREDGKLGPFLTDDGCVVI